MSFHPVVITRRGWICALLWMSLALATPRPVLGEYRAYLIEVYDHIAQKKWEEKTGFSPDEYILTHGGGNRLSVFTKATWMCPGDTSGYQPACPLPAPINPTFNTGERVRINLEKHITQGWIGIIELAYFQQNVNSNVYGVRFGDKRQMYNRYFEFNLEKAEPSSPPPQPNPAVSPTPSTTTQPNPAGTSTPAAPQPIPAGTPTPAATQ